MVPLPRLHGGGDVGLDAFGDLQALPSVRRGHVVLVIFERPNGRSTSIPRRSARPAASNWAATAAPSGLSQSGCGTSRMAAAPSMDATIDGAPRRSACWDRRSSPELAAARAAIAASDAVYVLVAAT